MPPKKADTSVRQRIWNLILSPVGLAILIGMLAIALAVAFSQGFIATALQWFSDTGPGSDSSAVLIAAGSISVVAWTGALIAFQLKRTSARLSGAIYVLQYAFIAPLVALLFQGGTLRVIAVIAALAFVGQALRHVVLYLIIWWVRKKAAQGNADRDFLVTDFARRIFEGVAGIASFTSGYAGVCAIASFIVTIAPTERAVAITSVAALAVGLHYVLIALKENTVPQTTEQRASVNEAYSEMIAIFDRRSEEAQKATAATAEAQSFSTLQDSARAERKAQRKAQLLAHAAQVREVAEILNLRRFLIPGAALIVGFLAARTFFASGTIGYMADWSVPASPQGLWAWGISDLSPWRPMEFGLPLAYPTEQYLKISLGLFGLFGVAPHLVVALFLAACVAVGFAGTARLTRALWDAPPANQICAGLLYATSPAPFDALIPGYLTFILGYAALPWLGESLLRGLRGDRSGWFGYAFFVGLSLAQVQFVLFDFALSATLVVAYGLSIRRFLMTAAFFTAGCVLPYTFIIINVLGTNIAGLATGWGQHSWTSLSAPGIAKAIMLVPSVYPFFDVALGSNSAEWRGLAAAFVIAALGFGFVSRLRAARLLAVLLVLCLIFLNGPNPPLTGVMTWLLNLPLLAILRNINYIFALVALLLPLLLTAPTRISARPYFSTALGILAVIWSLPWLSNAYAIFISPIPGPSDTKPIIGAADRTLVLPHLQVVDSRRRSDGGVNPNSVETITPVFVRNTPSGILEPSILDRLTDWQPEAQTFGATLRAASVNSIALQTSLNSIFPRYVNAYTDLWLLDAYETSNLRERLNQADSVVASTNGTTTTYRLDAPRQTDVQSSHSAIAIGGTAEYEIALRGLGISSIFIPAQQIGNARADWISGLALQLGAPELVPSPSDVREGAYLEAGIVTDHRTADFHTDWADIMDSANWWLSARLMARPSAAITSGDGLTFSIPVPPGRRHLWFEYYTSLFGGSLRLSGAVRATEIVTLSDSLGSFHWIDLGWTGRGRDLRITSVRGFNAVGDVAMLTSSEVTFDEQRFKALSRHWYAQVQPNATLSGEYAMNVGGERPVIMLGNPSNVSALSGQVLLQRDRNACTVLIRDAKTENLTVSLDGKRPDGGAPFPIATVACDSHSRVTLSGVELTNVPQKISHLSLRPQISVYSPTGHVTVSDVALTTLPLPFRPPSRGPHVLRFSYPSIFAKSGWSRLQDAVTSKPVLSSRASTSVANYGGTHWLTFTTSEPGTVLRHVALRPPLAGDHFEIAGTVVAPRRSKVQITLVHPGTNEFLYDFFGDGKPHDYHIDLFRYARHAGDQLYVLYYPPIHDASTARICVTGIQRMAANLIVSEHPFPAGQELQLRPTDLGMNRHFIAGPGRVVQYDQTYDNGWGISGTAEHYPSTSGFNVWVRRGQSDTATISYRTGVGYALGATFSLVAFCVLGLLSTRLPRIRKRNT